MPDDGTDMLVADKLSGKVMHVQVKANYSSQAAPPKSVQYDVQLTTFRASVSSFMLAAIIDPDDGALWRAWLIPPTELRAISIGSYDRKAASN